MTLNLNILTDSREQLPWEFEQHHVRTQTETLNTGDYTLDVFCEYDEPSDTYYPEFSIERKSGEDFVTSITGSRERFEREVKRASDWDAPFPVIIESPRLLFKRNRGFMQYRDVSPKVIFNTVEKWERFYNVSFHFTQDREAAQELAVTLLRRQLSRTLLD